MRKRYRKNVRLMLDGRTARLYGVGMHTAFPELLRARKAALDLSWPALAERCGVHEQAVKGWAAGEYLPARSRLADVARGLECSLTDVVLATSAPDGVTP